MPIRIIPKEYRLTKTERQALLRYLTGEQGIRETGRQLNTNHQNVPRILTAIIRHATIKGTFDAEALINKY